jgi:hypothetical protein
MPTFIRLTEYRDSDSKEAGFFDPNNRHTVNQDDFFKIPGSPIAYWVKNSVRNIFALSPSIKNNLNPKQGTSTGDDEKYVRFWYEYFYNWLGLGFRTLEESQNSHFKYFPLNKGGETRKWYGNNEKTLKFDPISYNELSNLGNHLPSKTLYFSKGLTWSKISDNLNVRYDDYGFIFSSVGLKGFPSQDENLYILSLLNSKIAIVFTDILSSTLSIVSGDIEKLPFILPDSLEVRSNINFLTQQCIDIAKEEWDNREMSWDFKQNELIRHKTNDGKIQSTYDVYCNYWREKFFQLHTNEEELNHLFIEIYGLEEELTPDVALEDITILKSEKKIIDDELVFNADEIARQFISYAVGCMFGRYSLDHEGLVVANMGQAIPTDTTFEIDDDNIIPVLEEEVFSDDIAARFERFVAVVFGEEFVGENIRWIEQSVGMDIRKYFVAEFYKDHVRRYKKRPIYWMVQSPKKGFSSLIYMHRYQSDTMARVQIMYLREYLTKIDSLIEHTRSVSNNPDSSAKDAKEAAKMLTKLEAKHRDALDFDRGDMSRVAALQIAIDLDDGVKVNYQKFKGVLPDIGLSKGED